MDASIYGLIMREQFVEAAKQLVEAPRSAMCEVIANFAREHGLLYIRPLIAEIKKLEEAEKLNCTKKKKKK